MADKKISELTEYTAPLVTDMLPILDVANGITKKVSLGTVYTRPCGMFSDSTTQTISSTTTAYPITFNTDEFKQDITHSTSLNTSRIQVDHEGTYLIIISAIASLASGTNQKLDVWVRVDGTDVPRSNTITNIVSTAEQIVAVPFIYTFTDGQYFEMIMRGSSTNVRLLATGTQTGPTRPACPSIILTINRISA